MTPLPHTSSSLASITNNPHLTAEDVRVIHELKADVDRLREAGDKLSATVAAIDQARLSRADLERLNAALSTWLEAANA